MFSHEKGGSKEEGGSGLMYLILLLFVGFVIWAYFAKFDQVITAEGKVYPFSGYKKSNTMKVGFR